MGHAVLLSNAQKCPRCPNSSQQRTFPFSLLIKKILIILLSSPYSVASLWYDKRWPWDRLKRRMRTLRPSFQRASTADFCSSPTLPSLLQSCNTTTSRLFPKHGNTRRCLQTQTGDKIGLGQVWSGLFRLGQPWSALVRFGQVVRSLQPAPSCVNSHQPQKWSVSVNKHCLAHCPSQC